MGVGEGGRGLTNERPWTGHGIWGPMGAYEKAQSPTDWINEEGVYRIAPATPSILELEVRHIAELQIKPKSKSNKAMAISAELLE